MPALGVRGVGGAGGTTRLDGAPCRTGPVNRLAEARLYATSPHMFSREETATLAGQVALRRFGGDCCAGCWRAARGAGGSGRERRRLSPRSKPCAPPQLERIGRPSPSQGGTEHQYSPRRYLSL